jgi:hypothetical protein
MVFESAVCPLVHPMVHHTVSPSAYHTVCPTGFPYVRPQRDVLLG